MGFNIQTAVLQRDAKRDVDVVECAESEWRPNVCEGN
jgi:hypothetical protein